MKMYLIQMSTPTSGAISSKPWLHLETISTQVSAYGLLSIDSMTVCISRCATDKLSCRGRQFLLKKKSTNIWWGNIDLLQRQVYNEAQVWPAPLIPRSRVTPDSRRLAFPSSTGDKWLQSKQTMHAPLHWHKPIFCLGVWGRQMLLRYFFFLYDVDLQPPRCGVGTAGLRMMKSPCSEETIRQKEEH